MLAARKKMTTTAVLKHRALSRIPSVFAAECRLSLFSFALRSFAAAAPTLWACATPLAAGASCPLFEFSLRSNPKPDFVGTEPACPRCAWGWWLRPHLKTCRWGGPNPSPKCAAAHSTCRSPCGLLAWIFQVAPPNHFRRYARVVATPCRVWPAIRPVHKSLARFVCLIAKS